MRTNTTRMRLVLLITCGIIAACALIVAQSPAPIAHFTATSAGVSGAGDAIRIEVLKWSTDADRDQLLNVWTHPNTPPPAAPAQAGAAAGAGANGAPAAGAGGGRGGAGRGGAGGGAGGGAVGGGGAAGGGAPQGAGRGGAGRGAGAAGAAAGAVPAAAGGAPPLPAADNAAGDAPPAAAAAAAGGRGGGRGGRGGGGGGGGAPAADAIPETPESALAAALQKRDTVAIMWTSEAAGYSLKFAYRMAQPDGSERIIFVTDRRLGLWSDQYWKPAAPATPTNLPFTVFELRLTDKGDGEGRTSLTGKVFEDTAAKSVALENYSALPVMLKSVKKVK